MKRITPLEPLLTCTDPEGLVVDGGVRVYDNRLAVSDDPRPKACVGVACSQGLWMSAPACSRRYWNATSAKLRSLRLCSRPGRSWRSSSTARMPMRRCWSTRSR